MRGLLGPLLLLLLARPLAARSSRGRGLEAVALSPDGKTVAVGGANRVVYFVSAADRSVQQRVWVGGRVTALVYLPSGGLLVEDDNDLLRIVDGGKVGPGLAGRRGLVTAGGAGLALTRDVTYTRGTRLWLLSLRDGKERGALDFPDALAAYALLLDGKQVLMLTVSRRGEEKLARPPLALTGLARKAFLQQHDGRVARLRVFDLATARLVRDRPLWYTSDSDSTVLVHDGAAVRVLNFANTCARIGTKETELFETEATFNQAIALSPDGRTLALGGLAEGWIGPLAGKRRPFTFAPLPGTTETVQGLAVANDGSAWAVTSAHRLVRTDATGKVLAIVPVF